MKRQGIALYNRGTQGMNSVVSGKLAKMQKGSLKYPHGNYPIEKYVIISVYEGNMADSIGALVDGVSKVNDKLGEKIGETVSGLTNASNSSGLTGKIKDATTVVKEKAADFVSNSTAKSSNDAFDDSTSGNTQGKIQSASGSATASNNKGSSGFLSSAGDLITGIAGGVVDAGGTLVSESSKVGVAGINDIISSVSKNGLGNGSVSDHAKSFVANIYLPLPNEIQEALSHSYEEEAGWVGDVKANMPFLDSGVNMAVGAAAFISKMTGSRSVTFDKNRVSMYTESAFRTISLSWALVPNNQEESKAIHEIAKSLKKYSSPESVSGKILLKSPHFFRLKFGNKLIDEALQFYEVVIEEIGIDYSPGGNMEMNHDDTPKTLSLNITFKDREPKLMEDWDKGVPKATEPSKPSCSAGSASKGTGSGSGSSTDTDKTGNSAKKAGAGGGSDAKDNSGKEQAKPPKHPTLDATDENWRDGSNDLPESDFLNDIYNESIYNPLTELDPKEKLPAETDVVDEYRMTIGISATGKGH